MDHHDTHTAEEHSGYGIYVLTWLALLALTAITVAVAGMDLGRLSISVAIVVAGVKATAVLLYFMHLKHESTLLKTMVLATIGTFVIFIGLTFFDILFR